jgi:hypothetical protein
MSRGEEKAAVNVEVLRAALREHIRRQYDGKGREAPPESTTPWFKAAADAADIAANTLKVLLRGEPVTASVLSTVMGRLQLSPLELISLDDQCLIPEDPAEYRRFRHGYFISELRNRPGKPVQRWCTETADLRAARVPGSAGGALTVKGKLTNELGATYEASGLRVGPYLLALTAQLQARGAARDLHHSVTHAFTAVFYLCYPLKRLRCPGEPGRVLCGLWHGVTRFGTPALYRFFLATRALQFDEINKLQKNLKAKIFLAAAVGGD